jgi:tripartite-type tricarboxylate transporter receptor subunit TctC
MTSVDFCRRLKHFAVAAVAAIAAFGASPAPAAWPERPITIIVPLAAGGGTDLIARMVATLLERDLGQPVNVVNRPGGNALVGLTAASKAPPDGYTLVALPSELAFFRPNGQGTLSYKDFSLIGMYNLDPASIHVRKDSPYPDVKALTDAIRKDPGAFSAGGAGLGSINHLAYVGLLEKLGIPLEKAKFVPTAGAAPAVQMLASGALQLTFTQLAEARALVEAGELRPLAVLSNRRDPKFADVPTIKEALGVEFAIGGWRGLGGPAGLPEEIRSKLEASLQKAIASAEFKEMMDKGRWTITWLNGKEFEAFHAQQDDFIARGLKAAGLAK